MTVQSVLEFVLQVVLTSLISSGFLLWLGRRWIESRFERSLKDYEYRINTLFSRVSKIHEKEFEVLPETWYKVHYALGSVADLTSPLQQYPDLNRMSEGQLREFLETSRLKESDKQTLFNSHDKNEFYQERIFWYRLKDTKEAAQEFHNYFILNRIFLTSDLRTQFEALDMLISDVMLSTEIGTQAHDHQMIAKASKKFRNERDAIVEEIMQHIQRRLRFERASD